MGEKENKTNDVQSTLSLKELLEARERELGIESTESGTDSDDGLRERIRRELEGMNLTAHGSENLSQKTEYDTKLKLDFGKKEDTEQENGTFQALKPDVKVDSEEKKTSSRSADIKPKIENTEKIGSESSVNKNEKKQRKKQKQYGKKAKQGKAAPESMKSVNDRLLAKLTCGDIKGTVTEPPKHNVSVIAKKVVMAILLVVMICASVYLLLSVYSRIAADEYYKKLREMFYTDMNASSDNIAFLPKDAGAVTENMLYSEGGDAFEAPSYDSFDLHSKYEKMLPNLEALKSINSAAFAWIRVEGTRVDYPVVQSPQGNNDYYLDHGLERTYSVSGTVFTDFNNSRNLSKNRNTCVYGHNMNDGTMFQTIMNFKTLNQFRNGTIEMYTKEGIYIYKPVAVYEAVPTESFFKVSFASDEEYASFLGDIKSKSIFKSSEELTTDDKIITLITCTNTIVDKRFVVHGVLTDIVK